MRETLAHLILAVMAALLPLYTRFASQDVSRSVKDNLAVAMLALVCVILPGDKRKIPAIAWVSLSACLALLILNQWAVISVNVVIQQIYIGLWACFAVRFYESFEKDRLNYILNGIAIGCIIQSILAIGDYFGAYLYGKSIIGLKNYFDPHAHAEWISYAKDGVGSAIGSLGNQNILSSFLALSSMALFRPKWKYFLILPVLGLIASGSMMGILSFVGGLIYLAIKDKQSMYIMGAVAMLVVWIGGGFGIDNGRVKLWNRSLENTRGYELFFGHGPGWFADKRILTDKLEITALENGYFTAIDFDAFLKGAKFNINSPLYGDEASMAGQEHNEFLSLFNVFGIPGLVLCLLLFKNFFTSEDFGSWPSILYVAFLNSFGHFSLHQSSTAIIIVIAGCVCVAQGKTDVFNLEW